MLKTVLSLPDSTEAMPDTEVYPGYDGYSGTYDGQWQDQWNWGTEGTDYGGEQFCGNVAFFVPFPGIGNMAPANASPEQEQGTQASKAGLQEMEAKVAKLEAENQRLQHLCETERQTHQINLLAKQQILEMYAVPRSEVEQLVQRFQGDNPVVQGGVHFTLGSNTSTTVSCKSKGSATSLETLLQDLYKKIYEPDESDQQPPVQLDDATEQKEVEASPEEEDVEHHLSELQRMVDMEVDDRAKASLLRLSARQAKLALRTVEDIIDEQGGFCHNLSSMVQSVCRKMGHTTI